MNPNTQTATPSQDTVTDNSAKMEGKSGVILESANYATYCMADDKLRLYVGRVPRDEYLKLKANGWTSTPKQDCDFVATWTPSRRDTALHYSGGVIEDEDMSPAERAADRAERFSNYRDKRESEAYGHADRYDSGPQYHGFQSRARAVRAADRHDRIAGHAVDAWDKAEYWQRRTAGVISHALHKCEPGVRMGRIKEIEAEIRKIEASRSKAHAEHSERHAVLLALVEHAEGKREKITPFPGWQYSVSYIREADKLPEDFSFTPEQMRRCIVSAVFAGEYSGRWQELRKQAQAGEIEAAAAAREWLDAHGWKSPEPCDPTKGDWHRHLTLRLAYENQMLGEQGGRLEQCEVLPGGRLGGRLVLKVNKSTATKRATSCDVLGPAETIRGRFIGFPGTEWGAYQLTLERLSPGSYEPPTPESLAELKAVKAKIKAGATATKGDPCPLINPTDEDAERLQLLWNEAARDKTKPSQVLRMTQAEYSARSGGSYSACETIIICETGHPHRCKYGSNITRCDVYKVRKTSCSGNLYGSDRVIVITDKPQKRIPWEAVEAARAKMPSPESLRERLPELAAALQSGWRRAENEQVMSEAEYVGWIRSESMSQNYWTDAGRAAWQAYQAEMEGATV